MHRFAVEARASTSHPYPAFRHDWLIDDAEHGFAVAARANSEATGCSEFVEFRDRGGYPQSTHRSTRPDHVIAGRSYNTS